VSRILITGGAGFIGGYLAEACAASGHRVTIADNFARGVRDPFLAELEKRGVEITQMDLLEQEWALPDDFEIVVHFAAIIGVRHVLERPYSVLRDNVALTDRAISFGRRQKKLTRFLFASTSEVMAGSLIHLNMPLPTPEDFPLALTDLAQPRTSYMLSKIYGEAMCQHSGIPFTIIRPHNIYGPRMGLSHVVPELLKKSYEKRDGEDLAIASADHSRAMCYISDAVQLIQRLLFADAASGGTFNIGNSETEVTIGDLARIIVSATGRKLNLIAEPAVAGSPSRRCPDMSKTIRVTGYTPSVGVEQGVRLTFDWYKQNVFAASGVSAL